MLRDMTHRIPTLSVVMGVLVSGCAAGIPQKDYDTAVAEAGRERGRADALEKRIGELERELASKKNAPPPGPDEKTKAELEELKAAKAAAEARLKTFDDLVKRFRKMIDAGKIDITTRRGQIVLALATDVLFDVGKTELKAEGKAALKEVAEAAKGVGGRRLQVAGHTDTAPIKTKEFPSNWELSTARAVVVVKLLVQSGVKASVLSAAGYAEFDPVSQNGTPQGRSKNRRIEIILQPNIEELISMPGLRGPDAVDQGKPPPPAKK